jgi:hypothetical protein
VRCRLRLVGPQRRESRATPARLGSSHPPPTEHSKRVDDGSVRAGLAPSPERSNDGRGGEGVDDSAGIDAGAEAAAERAAVAVLDLTPLTRDFHCGHRRLARARPRDREPPARTSLCGDDQPGRVNDLAALTSTHKTTPSTRATPHSTRTHRRWRRGRRGSTSSTTSGRTGCRSRRPPRCSATSAASATAPTPPLTRLSSSASMSPRASAARGSVRDGTGRSSAHWLRNRSIESSRGSPCPMMPPCAPPTLRVRGRRRVRAGCQLRCRQRVDPTLPPR